MSDRLNEAQAELDKMRAARDDDLTLFGDDVEAAVDSVLDHAGEQWKAKALEAVRRAALCNTTVLVTDVWMRLDEATYDARAIGGVMREAARRGWLTNTGQWHKSSIPEHHGRPLTVWRSNITGFHGTHWCAEEASGASNAE